MSLLQERIEADYQAAMKSRDRLRVDALRLIKSDLQRVAIDKRTETLADQDIVQVLNRQAKQRQETIEAAKKGGRNDVVVQTEQELAVLKAYLPRALSTEELAALIEEAIKAVGTNQGLIMKHVMGKTAGAADGKIVSQLVGARLKPAG